MKRHIPSWGRISAAPHQHLLVIRNGTVIRSMQGGSCFKLPADVVALVDTSVHRLQFTADQVTREKTGVRVTGLAVFRVVEPELAYRMLNLDEPSEYHEILREMFTGATRRLVANLTLEDCLTRRKDALASELLAEVAPVVQGGGQAADGTDRGWGVVIDTIEVQDVRILSEEVFSRLQAPYREGLALEAVRAEAEVEEERAVIEAQQARAREQHRRELMALEEARLEAERERARQRLAHDQELASITQESEAALARTAQEANLAAEQRKADAAVALQQRAAHAHVARERTLAEATVERDQLEAEARAQRERLLAEAGVETARLRAEALREEGAAAAEVQRLERAAMDTISEARLQELALTESLPRVAEAFADSFGEVTVVSGDMSFIGTGMAQAMASMKAVGFDLARVLSQPGGE
jgi:flotillin